MRKGRVLFESSLVVILGVAVLGATLAQSRKSDYSFMDPIISAKALITERYVDDVDPKKLQDGAIKGMVDALGDPYTVYVPASDKAEFTKELTGEYVGIGAQVNIQDGYLTIVSPLEDSPSFAAGLMAEDKIVEIDGKSTKGLSVEKCVELLVGQPDTTVQLLIERKGERTPYTITRKPIKTRSVKGYHREDADGNKWQYLIDPNRRIAYIRLTQFTPKCAAELAAALDSVGAARGELKGLVLDLRFNPGGLLNEAVDIADLFLKDGVIVSTRGRTHPEEVAKATSQGTLPEFPIAVILNGSSASASEVLAGALVDNNRAIVVGTRSFGKGSVQSVRSLARGNGAEIKMTEQGYYLPSGRSITRKDDSTIWGVDPTEGFYVPLGDDETIAMLNVRRQLEVLRSNLKQDSAAESRPEQNSNTKPEPVRATDWFNTDSVLETLKDKQLSAAVRAVQAKIDTGTWKPTGEKGIESGKLALDELNRLREFRQRLERELIKADKRIEAVEKGAVATAPSGRDLIPDGVELTGGSMIITDHSGKVVVTLDITGNNIERWLIDADVKVRQESAVGKN